MTKKELQEQINFLVSELKRLREVYNKLSVEEFNNRTQKLRFYGMYQKADEKAERYGGVRKMKKRKLRPVIKWAFLSVLIIATSFLLTIGGLLLASEQHYKILESYEVINK